jgi:putative aminopeptidase FrvX
LKSVALKISRKKEIPTQLQAVYGNSYTDAAAISQEFSGIPSISLGIPVRYSHAPSSVCHLRDMELCLDLAEGMLRRGMGEKDLNFLQED